MSSEQEGGDHRPVSRLLLAILALGQGGTVVELALLEHYESFWQWMPLVVLGIGLVCTVAVLVTRRRWIVLSYRVAMTLLILIGALGLVQHYQSNVEFELEMYPSRAGVELFWEAVRGATPALAPGALMFIGLVGWVGGPPLRRSKSH